MTADHTPERRPTLPFTLRMPTNRVDNPDGGSLNTGTNHVDVQVILDPDMELRGECRSGYAGPVIALREWDEQVFLHELLHAAVAYARPLVATTHPPHGHEVIARVEVALWETGWRLAPAGRRPVTADHTPERLGEEERLRSTAMAASDCTEGEWRARLFGGEWQIIDDLSVVARMDDTPCWDFVGAASPSVILTLLDSLAALRAECDVLREQTARVKALREKWTGTRDGVLSPGLRRAVDDLDREWFQKTVERRGREAAALLHPQDPDQERTSG